VLWRNVGALEYYTSLGSEYDGLRLPDIEVAGAMIAPQHLELIEKLSRSADRSAIRDLLREALSGRLKRSTLQERWRIYREKGRLAPRRGRGVSEKDRTTRAASPKTVAMQSEAKAILQLAQAAPDWTGCQAPTLFRVFAAAALTRWPGRHRVDVVALSKPAPDQPVAVHGVEIQLASSVLRGGRLHRVVERLVASSQDFDNCWLAVATDKVLSDADVRRVLAVAPAQVGVLEIRDSVVKVLRMAPRNPDASPTQLLAELLTSRGVV
jgi:hypothetical protein